MKISALTTIVLVVDAAAALILVGLITRVQRVEQKIKRWAPLGVCRLNLIRRFVYAAMAVVISYRIWDVVESGRNISTPGALFNLVMVTGVVALAFGRWRWVREEL